MDVEIQCTPRIFWRHGDKKSPSPGSNRNRLAIDISVLPGKSQFLIGKPSINGPSIHGYVSHNQRVNENKISQNQKKTIPWKLSSSRVKHAKLSFWGNQKLNISGWQLLQAECGWQRLNFLKGIFDLRALKTTCSLLAVPYMANLGCK